MTGMASTIEGGASKPLHRGGVEGLHSTRGSALCGGVFTVWRGVEGCGGVQKPRELMVLGTLHLTIDSIAALLSPLTILNTHTSRYSLTVISPSLLHHV